MIKLIKYRAGYKYQLVVSAAVQTSIKPAKMIKTEYINLLPSGVLVVKEGYAWDGPSGPTIDTNNFMRGSLFHDALYQLMREGHLDHHTYREPADRLLQELCLEDGMSGLRAWWVYQGVRLGGGTAADPVSNKPILAAP